MFNTMLFRYFRQATTIFTLTFVAILAMQRTCMAQLQPKPRILISSDIGGSDPDDNQSMIHLLMYADLFQIEGLVSSPPGRGRKKDFFEMIDLYEKDLPQLRQHSVGFPLPKDLRKVVKQGAIPEATYKGFGKSTEGSNWIVRCAKKKSDQPLWVLVWGGLEDLAQALHDAPEIKSKIKVYWIGGPNKKWGINAYAYIAENHPDLWIIENNATYRGLFMETDSTENAVISNYYDNYIRARGALGKAFKKYYNGKVKMGDTPSLAFLMNESSGDPLNETWGGSFEPINHSSRRLFNRNSTNHDTVATYSTIEWRFKGPAVTVHPDSACFFLHADGQAWPGYYLGNEEYGVRYSSKRSGMGSYQITSNIATINGQSGQYISITPWPGPAGANDYKTGAHWYSDRKEPSLFIEDQQGAKTIMKYRQALLLDWAKRWDWLQ